MADIDPWAAFNGDPAAAPPLAPANPQFASPQTATPAAPGQAAGADPWAAFAGTPVAGPPAASAPATPAAPNWQSVDPRPLQPNEPGYNSNSDQMVNLSPADWAAFSRGESPPARPPAPLTGTVANVAAGGNEALASTIGLPVDLMTGGLNLAARGINAVTGSSIPQIVDPVGGSASLRRAMGLVGANPDDVQAPDGWDRAARAIGQGVVGALVPAGGAALAVRTGLAAAPAAEAAVSALGAPTAGNVALSAGAAVGGQQAADFAPEPYKPIANLVGSLGTGVALAGAGSATRAASDYLAPRAVAPSRMQPVTGQDGAPITRADGTSVTASPGQADAAAGQLRSMMSDPAAAAGALAQDNPELVPGSQPTTFQLTQDPRLGQFERGAARSGTDASAQFITRATQQNDARVATLRGVAPDGDLAAVAAQAKALDPTQPGAAAVAQAQTGASAATDALGGNLPAGSDGIVGTALRAPIAAANAAAKTEEGALWREVDPNGTVGVSMTPIRQRAQDIVKGESPNAAPMAGAERQIFDTATQLPPVQSFRDLSALRQTITDTIRAARPDPARAQEVRRLSTLLDGVHDAMAGTVEQSDAPAIAPAAGAAGGAAAPVSSGGGQVGPGAPVAPATGGTAPGVGSDAFTPFGTRVGVRYEVADAPSLVTSHNPDGAPNPAFPPQLQPRARDRAASQVQVANIASRLQPERLGASSSAADGAPIVGDGNVVESGNGRVMALRQAYAQNGPQAAAYRDWLAGQGHDISGIQQPVLIRRRVTPMSPQERVAFTQDANAPIVLGLSATERAARDAGRLPDEVLHQFQPGDVADPANRAAVRGFLHHVVEPGAEGGFVAADGQLSQEGAARVRAALVHRAYGDAGLSAALTESTDPTAKVLAGAMQDAAGPMAQLRAGIEAGHVDPGVDIAPHLVEAARTVARARQQGISLADAVGQRDMLGNGVSPDAENLLHMAYGPDLRGRMSREGFASGLADYARQAGEQSSAGNLFGANLTTDQILEGVSARYGKVAGGGNQGRGLAAGSAGQGNGQGGYSGRGPIPSAGRQAAPGGSGGQGRDAAPVLQAPAPTLTPSWDDTARARYDAARAATAGRAATYKNAPGVGPALKSGPTSGSFTMADHAVPAAILTPGPSGAARVQVYLAAGGSRDALHTAAAFTLRQKAVQGGAINPAALDRFTRDYGSALSAMPELRQGIDTASRAQQTVEAAQAQHAADVKAYQGSLLGKLAGNGDTTALIGQALRNPVTGARDMRLLARATENNPDARAGLQRAVMDHILGKVQGVQAGVGSSEGQLHAGEFQMFIRQAGPALREVMSPQQMEAMTAVAADLQRSNLSVSGTRVPGGSDTVQNRSNAAAVSGEPQTLLRSLVDEGKKSVLGNAGIVTSAVGGNYLFGPVGTAVGAVMGATPMAMRAVANARAAGMANVHDIVREAMLNPALARVLLARPTPKAMPNVATALVATLGRASLQPDSRSTEAQRHAEGARHSGVPPNALAGVGAVAAPASRNALAPHG